jgi:hypothetical protein
MAGPVERAPARKVAAGQIAADVLDGDPQTTDVQVGAESGGGNVRRAVRPDLVRVPPAARPRNPHGSGRHDGVVEVTGDPDTSGLGARRHQALRSSGVLRPCVDLGVDEAAGTATRTVRRNRWPGSVEGPGLFDP